MRPCEEKATDMGVVRPVMAMNESSIGRSTQYDSLYRTEKGQGGASSSSSGGATEGAPANASATGPHAVCEDAMPLVQLPADVLGHILGFVITSTTGRATIKVLNQLSLVCRAWRAALSTDCWWSAVADDVVPALWLARRGEGLHARTVIMGHGRCMWEAERQPWVGPAWTAGLSIHFEAFDVRDGLKLLSLQGDLYHHGPTQDSDWETWSKLEVVHGSERCEAVAFSARRFEGRDTTQSPQMHAIRNMCWSNGYKSGYTCPWLRARVWVADARHGTIVLLWDGGAGLSSELSALPGDERDRNSPAWYTWGSDINQAFMSPTCPDAKFRMGVQLCAYAEPGQEHVPAADRQWRVFHGEERESEGRSAWLFPPVLVVERVGEWGGDNWSPGDTYVARFIKSLLAY